MTHDEYTDMVLDQQQRFGEPDTVKHHEYPKSEEDAEKEDEMENDIF